MALFSRKKSKVKKAAKAEEKQAAADASAAATPTQTPSRGRNGKTLAKTQSNPEKASQDIPMPTQLPRDYDGLPSWNQRPSRGRSDSFDDHPDPPNRNPKYDGHDPHRSGDSGYASVGPESRVHSRNPSTNQLRQEFDYFLPSNKSMPQLTLGEELSREPAFSGHEGSSGSGRSLKPSRSLSMMRKHARFDRDVELTTRTTSHQGHHQDARYQRQVQQSMPMRPSSVPPQALQARSERVIRPPPHRSSSPGPYEWGGHMSPTRGPRLQPLPFQPRSPTSPTANDTSFSQDTFSPSLNILNGLKVNKRGLILDEEGDPIGELYEGDIIDCVRQRANAYGDVFDEYGRIVGRVRTLPSRISEPPTSPPIPRSDGNEQPHQDTQHSAPPNESATESQSAVRSATPAVINISKQLTSQGNEPSSPKSPRHARYHEAVEQSDYLSMPPSDRTLSQRRDHQQAVDQQENGPTRFHTPAGSMKRSESLPSVPESHSTSEATLSDASSHTSESSQDATIEDHSADEHLAGQEQVQKNVPSRPSTGRSVSDQTLTPAMMPPVPALPKHFTSQKGTAMPSFGAGAATHAQQPMGLHATPSRVKSPPLPSFPGRGFTGGLPGGSPFASGPVPGMPVRRLTTPGFPMPPSVGMAGSNGQLPALRSRASGSTPLVRSPLSSQGSITLSPLVDNVGSITDTLDTESTPPPSEQGSAEVETKPPFGHSRSQSLKTVNTTANTAGAGKPRKVFGHAAKASVDKEADIVVKEIGDEKKPEKKKKGMKGLFGRKK